VKVSIVVVGLGFGEAFLPIYQRHPNVGRVGICESDQRLLREIGDRHAVEDRFSSLERALADDRYNAVHLVTPVPLHVEQTLETLAARKHCACAVPIATDLDDIYNIIEAQKKAGVNYMMMETGAYTREFLYARDMHARGEFGNFTFFRGVYHQDLEGAYPRYWRAQPPMHYATHVVGPILCLAKTRATSVSCLGAGVLRPDIQQPGGNTFPLQTAIFRLADGNMAAEVTRSWFQTARGYTEAFSAYGDRAGFEWQQIEWEDPVVFRLGPVQPERRGRDAVPERVKVPFRPYLFPSELADYTEGWHGGSHPHLVHEFISSIVQNRPPAIDAAVAATWTAPGICANLSSLANGALVEVPAFVT